MDPETSCTCCYVHLQSPSPLKKGSMTPLFWGMTPFFQGQGDSRHQPSVELLMIHGQHHTWTWCKSSLGPRNWLETQIPRWLVTGGGVLTHAKRGHSSQHLQYIASHAGIWGHRHIPRSQSFGRSVSLRWIIQFDLCHMLQTIPRCRAGRPSPMQECAWLAGERGSLQRRSNRRNGEAENQPRSNVHKEACFPSAKQAPFLQTIGFSKS